MSKAENTLWDIANEMRKHRPFDPLDILQTAKSRGVSFNLKDVLQLLAARYGSEFFCPEFIPQFINAYIRNMDITSVLDVWAGIGAMITPIINEIKPNKAIALEQNQQAYEIAQLLGHEAGIEWRLGSPLSMLDEIEQNFDVILGNPPWNINLPIPVKFSLDDKEIRIRDNKDKLLILKASLLLLSHKGVGFFITDGGFTTKRSKYSVYSNLSRFGLFIDAVLALPSGTFPGVSLGGLLVIIRNQKPKQLFVGELSSNKVSNGVVLKNLKARKNGKVPQHGILVKPKEFYSFQALISRHEASELAYRLGFPPTPLSKIALDINLTNSSQPDGFVDHPNTIYLPLIGKSPAVTSLADLQIKPHNYAQIVVDQDKAIAEYLSHFFNTTIGHKIRESLKVGSIIPRISKSQLCQTTIYIPDRNLQEEVLQVDASIAELSTQLETFNRQLWEQPRKTKEILKSVNSLNREESFENWLDSLPFPLASILWLYHTEDKPKNKLEHLLNFFEALSQFNTVLLLSAYATDLEFYTQNSNKWLDKDPKYLGWYKTASFGNWNIIGERLAKQTRCLLNDKKTHEFCLDLFGQPSSEFMDLITDKRLFAILNIVKDYRNPWKGHGGIVSSRDAHERWDMLKRELSKVQQLVADRYSTGLLLRATNNNTYEDGIFNYRVHNLMGRITPFKKVRVKTLLPMETQKLYLLHENQLKPIELLPFIWLESSEEEPHACYFYSRVEKDQAHYVSYHYVHKTGLSIPLEKLRHTLSLLDPESRFIYGGEHEKASNE
jgi:hypothetical protein